MSKTGKIIVIIGGAAAFLLVALLAVVFFVSWLAGDGGAEQSRIQGADFGKTTDSAGCQAEGISRIRKLGLFDVTESVKAQYFVKGCLETSRSSADFCKGVPTATEEFWANDGWKDEQCRKLGWTEMNPNCRTVMRARLEFCEKR
jgi:hypothetical protein